ncbi:ArsC family reductase [Bowmanella sp. JS7-9]|uniref:ArsC family reductase n=1 Tax=Pseudobowmanella zhangzhouensis TaxID=1537679 RepID=A0ABW1XI40_9ALTE|nr:ArsC family reductase [Bowmanella sp. JS7-9]TBX27601.1 hypothetical protein TK45_00210 [Bowmanella sp. JS7-9]
MTTMFGISNCDTIKKAKAWLTQQHIEFSFHDYRKDGLSEAWLINAEQALGWQQLLNTRGTTYRQLPDADKQNMTQSKAIELMLAHPAMIKRPVLIHNEQFYLGFKAAQYAGIFA